MSTNGKQTEQRLNDFQLPPYVGPTKPQSLVKAEQAVDQIAAHFALVKQKQDLDLERKIGNVAVLNSAQPIVEKIFGDPNHKLQQLTRVLIERGCDVAEDCIELVIDD